MASYEEQLLDRNKAVSTGNFWDRLALLSDDKLKQAAHDWWLNLPTPSTQKIYQRAFVEYLDFALKFKGRVPVLADLNDLRTAREWVASLKKKHQVREDMATYSSTVAYKVSALSSFFNSSMQMGHVDRNPFLLTDKPKQRVHRHTEFLDESEAAQLLGYLRKNIAKYPSKKGPLYRKARLDYAIILTLLSVGMRQESLVNLRIEDVLHQKPPRLKLFCKGGETQCPAIQSSTYEVLNKWIADYRSLAEPKDYVFTVRAKRGKLTGRYVLENVRRHSKDAGITKNITPHSLRATLATLLYRKGVSIVKIQNLLNHKDISTTRMYINIAEQVYNDAATIIDFDRLG